MTRSFPPALLATLLAALTLGAGLTGCAEAQRVVNDATRVATAGGMTTTTAASWSTTASDMRGQAGTIAYDCPPSPATPPGGSVWGSGPYTDDSRVCKAGVHAGAISTQGGRVLIQMRPGQNRYVGSTRNGIQTSDYGSWGGSFVVLP